jgi:hypothetical protein
LDQALREEVATKTDIAAVKTGLAADIAALKTELSADIATGKSELSADIAAVKHDVLRWIVSMAFAQVGLTVAHIRFLPH